MARDGESGGPGNRDDNRGDDRPTNKRGAGAARRAAAAAAAAAAPVAAPAAPELVKAPKAEPVAPLAKPAKKAVLGGLGANLVGAINRSSGNTGRANLNPAAVSRARKQGTTIGTLVNSIDGSRARSQAGGIAKKAGVNGSSKIIDTSGL